MKDTRKELRIRIPDTLRPAFNRAKLKAEQELGMVMTDNEYGRRVLVLALRNNDAAEKSPIMTDEEMQEFQKQLKRQG